MKTGKPFRCDDGLVVVFIFIQDDLVISEVGWQVSDLIILLIVVFADMKGLCKNGCVLCACPSAHGGGKKMSDPLGVELRMIVSYYMGVGAKTWVL